MTRFAAVDWLVVVVVVAIEHAPVVVLKTALVVVPTTTTTNQTVVVRMLVETCHQKRRDCVLESFVGPLQLLHRGALYFDNLDTCIEDHKSWTMQSIDSTASSIYTIQ